MTTAHPPSWYGEDDSTDTSKIPTKTTSNENKSNGIFGKYENPYLKKLMDKKLEFSKFFDNEFKEERNNLFSDMLQRFSTLSRIIAIGTGILLFPFMKLPNFQANYQNAKAGHETDLYLLHAFLSPLKDAQLIPLMFILAGIILITNSTSLLYYNIEWWVYIIITIFVFIAWGLYLTLTLKKANPDDFATDGMRHTWFRMLGRKESLAPIIILCLFGIGSSIIPILIPFIMIALPVLLKVIPMIGSMLIYLLNDPNSKDKNETVELISYYSNIFKNQISDIGDVLVYSVLSMTLIIFFTEMLSTFQDHYNLPIVVKYLEKLISNGYFIFAKLIIFISVALLYVKFIQSSKDEMIEPLIEKESSAMSGGFEAPTSDAPTSATTGPLARLVRQKSQYPANLAMTPWIAAIERGEAEVDRILDKYLKMALQFYAKKSEIDKATKSPMIIKVEQ